MKYEYKLLELHKEDVYTKNDFNDSDRFNIDSMEVWEKNTYTKNIAGYLYGNAIRNDGKLCIFHAVKFKKIAKKKSRSKK